MAASKEQMQSKEQEIEGLLAEIAHLKEEIVELTNDLNIYRGKSLQLERQLMKTEGKENVSPVIDPERTKKMVF